MSRPVGAQEVMIDGGDQMLTDVFVPLLTFPDDAKPTALPRLSGLVERFATHITYCGVEINVPDLADRWGGALIALPQMIADAERRSRQNASDLLLSTRGLSQRLLAETFTIRAAFGSTGPAIARRARHHDLSAMTLRRGSVEHAALAENLMFDSTRPLLVVPDGNDRSDDASRIAVAWDDSPTASRALYDAMPLLVGATDVAVLTAHEDKPVSKAAVEATLGYLQRHGVKARMVHVDMGTAGIGKALQQAAVSEQAGLLVMGAYGHSRLREFVLGGATAGVLNDPLLPIFFSR
jgi:nucleotide-binding universal stress UspA family protein